MKLVKESVVLDKRLQDRFYAPSHERHQFFNEKPTTDIESAFEEYLAGAVASFDMDPFDDEVSEKLKTYILNAPVGPTLYRIEAELKDTANCAPGVVIYRRLSSWSKSLEAILDMANNLSKEDIVILKLVNARSINVEGYAYFYEQRESITYGNLRVIGVDRLHIKQVDQWAKFITVEQK